MKRFLALVFLGFTLAIARPSPCQLTTAPPVLARFPFEDTVPLKIVRDAGRRVRTRQVCRRGLSIVRRGRWRRTRRLAHAHLSHEQ